MKKLITATLFACVISASAFAEPGDDCSAEENPDSPNPIISILSFPFKMVAAITWGPRCAAKELVPNTDPE